MSNESRENLQGTDGRDAADLTTAAGQAVPEPTTAGQAVPEPAAAAAVDACRRGGLGLGDGWCAGRRRPGCLSRSATGGDQQSDRSGRRPSHTQGEVVIAPPAPRSCPRASRAPGTVRAVPSPRRVAAARSWSPGLGLTYTDHATGRGPPGQRRPGLPRALAERDPGADGPPRPRPVPDPRGPRGAAGRPHRRRALALAGPRASRAASARSR